MQYNEMSHIIYPALLECTGCTSSGELKGHWLKTSAMLWGFSVQEGVEPPHQSFAHEFNVPKQVSALISNEL